MLDFDMFGPVWQERSASGEVRAWMVALTSDKFVGPVTLTVIEDR